MSCNALCGTPSRRSRSMSTRWSPRPESRPPPSSRHSRTWKCAAWFSKDRGWCFRLRDCGFRIADWKGGRRIRNPQLVFTMHHLYVHVPFCRRRCTYCDFSIAVRKRIPAREYVDAVLQELTLLGTTDPGREPGDIGGESLESLYLGGGTPSLLPPEAISALLTSLRDVFRVTSSRDAVEVTLEANPEDVTPEIAEAWRRAGINRVSLGAQSFDN